MKLLLFSLFLVSTSAFAAPVELFSGLLSYDMPEFFYRLTPPGDPGGNPFSGRSRPIEFGELGNSPERLRQLNVSIRAVGFSIGEGKRVITTPLSFDDLKKEMEQRLHYGAGAAKPEATSFAGHRALHIKATIPRGRWSAILQGHCLGATYSQPSRRDRPDSYISRTTPNDYRVIQDNEANSQMKRPNQALQRTTTRAACPAPACR